MTAPAPARCAPQDHAKTPGSGKHVERVTDVGVAMPRDLLRRADLKLGDAESRALQVMRDPLDIKAGR